MELFAKEDFDFLKEAFKKDVEDFKALFKSPKGIMTIVEFVSRFIPSVLFVVLALVFSNRETSMLNGLITCGIPLVFVGFWAIINRIAVKRFGINV